VLRAFASGCAALTGVEAVSDGVPAFKPPEAKNARIVLAWLGVILISLFVGITFLTRHYHLTPLPEQTILSQLARQIFGDGVLYYSIQASTMLILVLAANTAFADFPRLSFFLSRDGFPPPRHSPRPALPPPVLLPRAGRLPASPVRIAGRPPRLLERHPHPGRHRRH